MKPHRAPLAILASAITLFYARLLFTACCTIQWDAVGQFYPYQRYFSDSIRAGRLPFWNPVVFSGFPFLADMQVGAWYPLNWPFFLLGISPRSLFWELWLHAILAAWGMYFLTSRFVNGRIGGVLAALIYSLSGSFAAHSEHIGLFQAAAWLPWLLLTFWNASTRVNAPGVAIAGLVGGCLVLAGHFQTALYAFSAAFLFGIWLVWEKRANWRNVLLAFLGLCALSLALSAIQLLPSAELLRHSLRASLSATDFTNGIASWSSLATFAIPTAAGTLASPYAGLSDISQHYFYVGAFLLPLAFVGLIVGRHWRLFLLLIAIPVLYAMGPMGGIYSLLVKLPGFASVRAPSHVMFLPTLTLAILAAVALTRISRRTWLAAAIGLFCFADLYYWNMHRTPLVYAKGSYERVYGPSEEWFRGLVQLPRPPLTRIAAPGRWEFFYPAVAPMWFGVETTFGSNPLYPTRYYEYLKAAEKNDSLMAPLGVSLYFDRTEWATREYRDGLPKFHFPAWIHVSGSVLPDLETTDARQETLLDAADWTLALGVRENARGSVKLLAAAPEEYRVQLSAEHEGVLRIGIPWFPGWRAEVDGKEIPVRRADHALMAVSVPAGVHELRFFYQSTYFAHGAWISALAFTMAGLTLVLGAERAPEENRISRSPVGRL